MADYDDERPDWRELDRRKDRSGFYGRQEKGEKGAKKEGPKNRWQSGRVKNALDRIFLGDKGTPEHDKLYNRLHGAYGSGTFLKHVNTYIKKYGLPDDAPTLLLILDTKDEGIVTEAIEKLKAAYGSLQARQREDVRRKLSILAVVDRSQEIRRQAGEALEELGQ
ncbi:MAG: hypothetical protein A4E64_02779 [Syntrophorhabdus sp. PtaU1.Bin058]|nr:MAG: hypothetical protein A4E64_02779 [Syntrophorhabdus sp. PtaU1.Bin058]